MKNFKELENTMVKTIEILNDTRYERLIAAAVRMQNKLVQGDITRLGQL